MATCGTKFPKGGAQPHRFAAQIHFFGDDPGLTLEPVRGPFRLIDGTADLGGPNERRSRVRLGSSQGPPPFRLAS